MHRQPGRRATPRCSLAAALLTPCTRHTRHTRLTRLTRHTRATGHPLRATLALLSLLATPSPPSPLLSLLSPLSLLVLLRAQDLTSVRDIMTQNIQDVLGRGEALDCAPIGG